MDREDSVAAKETLKLEDFRWRGYVGMIEVKILVYYLSVHKGDYIRMFYNGTSSRGSTDKKIASPRIIFIYPVIFSWLVSIIL